MSFCRKLSVVMFASMVLNLTGVTAASSLTLKGTVASDKTGLPDYEVTLFAIFVQSPEVMETFGPVMTGPSGEFEIIYALPPDQPPEDQPILVVTAEKGSAMLASAIGRAPVSGPVVVNELTTVATGFAFAQFIDGTTISGNEYGMINAVHMAANMADPVTGAIAEVLDRLPNADETEARRTFNSLANIVANCVATKAGCDFLSEYTTLPGGPPPATVLQAVANIAKYPWQNVAKLFELSFELSMAEAVYGPALTVTEKPDAWTLFLKFTGGFYSEQNAMNLLNGPGAFAIDEQGYLWVNDNYVPEEPTDLACAGKRLLKFYPWGANFAGDDNVPGSPYFGGGLSGAGFGITIAPDGRIWVGNFGFAGVVVVETGPVEMPCPKPPSNSVSVFKPDGTPTPSSPLSAGSIYWPQATVADPAGNIWIANCGKNIPTDNVYNVTVYPNGDPHGAFDISVANAESDMAKPFGIAIDHKGNAWVTANSSGTVTVFGPKGDWIRTIVLEHLEGEPPYSAFNPAKPMGVAADSQGNIWVSNSNWVDLPCPPSKPPPLGPGTSPSIALYDLSFQPHLHGSPFKGGGLILPWGIAVDGNDTVWVANFGFPFDVLDPEAVNWLRPNRVSHFCGVDTSKCPLPKQGVGMPISPDITGYTSLSLDRNTGVAIDPSGNVWLANNWREIPLQENPGANSIAVMVGAARPVRTPLIGPAKPFE